MNFSQRSLFSTEKVKIKKFWLSGELYLYKLEKPTDDSELFWKYNSSLLESYWLSVYQKFGVSLQNCLEADNCFKTSYSEYFQTVIDLISSNKIYGIVDVQSVEDNDEFWCLETKLPPVTLLNCLRYTPIKLKGKHDLLVYIIFQVLSTLEELHTYGIPHGALYLHGIYIDEQLKVKISVPNFTNLMNLIEDSVTQNDKYNEIVEQNVCGDNDLNDNALSFTEKYDNNLECHHESLEVNLYKWVTGQLSNLNYLLYLNKLAGRVYSDPNNHPMIPWVTDFSEPYRGLRDLTQSKFRINKGDEHLNKIYQDQKEELDRFQSFNPLEKCLSHISQKDNVSAIGMPKSRSQKRVVSNSNCPICTQETEPPNPHHVSDVLSELSYYAYMARVTPVETLKKSYRSFYNPEEFRWSMAKMYSWSPDECVPQFFLDPSILKSQHTDMPDIELPRWCGSSAEEFIEYHRELLESDEVSRHLHHWIDLVFGYKLLGQDAIDSRNVHRQFSEKNPKLTNNGLSVLFRVPHPKRILSNDSMSKYFSSQKYSMENVNVNKNDHFSGNMKILPDDYDPCSLLEYYKHFTNFVQDSCLVPPTELDKVSNIPRNSLKLAMERDVLSVCCLVIELFNSDKLSSDYVISSANFEDRIQSCFTLFNEAPSRIPLSFRGSVEKILKGYLNEQSTELNVFYFPSITELKRLDSWFLFNKTVSNLYDMIKSIDIYPHLLVECLNKYLQLQMHYEAPTENIVNLITVSVEQILVDRCNRINEMEQIERDKNFEEIVDVVVIILKRLGLLAGRVIITEQILPHILKLFPLQQNEVRSCHVKLYQQTFLKLLLNRIGMINFINNLVSLLVTAVIIGQNTYCSHLKSTEFEADMKTALSTWYVNVDGEETSLNKGKVSSNDVCENDSISVESLTYTNDSEVGSIQDDQEEEMSVANINGPDVTVSNSLPYITTDYMVDNSSNTDSALSSPKPGPSNLSSNTPIKYGNFIQSPLRKAYNGSNVVNARKHQMYSEAKIRARPIMSQDCSKISLAEFSCSSLLWLADIIGPILACRKILSELLSQYSVQFRSSQNGLVPFAELDKAYQLPEPPVDLVTGTRSSIVVADVKTTAILDCIRGLIALYGPALIHHSIRHFLDSVFDRARIIVNQISESQNNTVDNSSIVDGLICSLSLLRFLVTLISNEELEAYLSDRILDEYIPFIIKTTGSTTISIVGSIRRVMLHKVIELVYILSTRLQHSQIQTMITVFQLLFQLFTKVFTYSHETKNVSYRPPYNDILSWSNDLEPDSIDATLKFGSTTASQFVINFDDNHFTVSNLQKTNKNCQKENEVANSKSETLDIRNIAFNQLKEIITYELASVLYITFARLFGENRLNSLIYNHVLIRALVDQQEAYLNNITETPPPNQHDTYILPDKIRQHQFEEFLQKQSSFIYENQKRHLGGIWSQYWVHQLGFGNTEPFSFKQMCLAEFAGHSNSVKGFDVLYCENGFLSYSKDKTVRLYSCADIDYRDTTEYPSMLSSQGSHISTLQPTTVTMTTNSPTQSAQISTSVYRNYTNKVPCRFIYQHNKPVTDALFLEESRLVVSLDGTVHLWDPFVGKKVLDTSLGVSSPCWSMMSPIPPARYLLTVCNSDGRVITMDTRTGGPCYSFNFNIHNQVALMSNSDFANSMGILGGLIKQIAVSGDGHYLVFGNTEGCLSVVDFRAGSFLGSWRPHQSEVTQIKFIGNNWFVSSSNDYGGRIVLSPLIGNNYNLFGGNDIIVNCQQKHVALSMDSSNISSSSSSSGSELGPIHSLMPLPGYILAGHSQNRFSLYTSLNSGGSFASVANSAANGAFAGGGVSSNVDSRYLATSSIKLSPSLYKGSVTTSCFMGNNQLLLLGNDVGNISIWY